jgi:hypothetical protein
VLRFFDQTRGDRPIGIWNPEGTPSGDHLKTAAGRPSKIQWGGFPDIAKAMAIAEDDSRANISERLGGNHKVRNFYNNIISPNFGVDATIDTHAVGAALLMPVGGEHPLVGAGLGTSGSKNAETGLKALYPLYSEAYRRAAETISERENRDVMPREMQSMAWEAVRGVWDPDEKANPAEKERVANIWKDYHDGKLSLEDAAKKVITRGIRPPRWAT